MKMSTPRNWAPLWSPQMVILCGSTAMFWFLQASRLADVVVDSVVLKACTTSLSLHRQIHPKQ